MKILARDSKYNKYLLSGILACNKCQSPLKARKGSNGYSYYVCTGKLKNSTSCDLRYINTSTIDEYIITEVSNHIMDEIIKIESGEKSSVDDEIKKVRVEIDEIKNSNIVEISKLIELNDKWTNLNSKKESEIKNRTNFNAYKNKLSEWKELDKTDHNLIRDYLKYFIEKIVVSENNFKIHYKF